MWGGGFGAAGWVGGADSKDYTFSRVGEGVWLRLLAFAATLALYASRSLVQLSRSKSVSSTFALSLSFHSSPTSLSYRSFTLLF